MSERLEAVSDTGILERARVAMETELAAAADLLIAAVEWAEAHPAACADQAAGWGAADLHGEGLIPLAGEGTPLVAEFAPLTLAGELGLTPAAGLSLVGDALELKYRLPRLWGAVVAYRVPAWRARQVAQRTTALDSAGADQVDAWAGMEIAANPGRLTVTRIENWVREATLYADPDRIQGEEEAEAAHRYVTLTRRDACGVEVAGTTEILMRLDTLDALAFGDRVAQVACLLGELGDTRAWDVRRAAAVGVLADPHHALDLLTGATNDVNPAPSVGNLELVVHVNDSDIAHIEGHRAGGPASTDLVAEWASRLAGTSGGRVTIRPVLDLTDDRSVDVHDPPAWMRQAALLRDATCVFPACTRNSRHTDLDHIQPYQPIDEGGPPGQTSLANLAPLCRRHHRMKTFGHWNYLRLDDHHYLWTSPTGTLIITTSRQRR